MSEQMLCDRITPECIMSVLWFFFSCWEVSCIIFNREIRETHKSVLIACLCVEL